MEVLMMQNNIHVIHNTKQHFNKKNVCAYARVSSDKDLQLTSFEAQVSYYTNYILKNDNWNFVGVYSDEGISGTSTNNRDGFNLMIDLAKLGQIDLIITKSISRFSRNTIDTLTLLRELKTYGTEVFFEKENISSFDNKIEFVISVLASMAEEESRNISDNVKWGVRKGFKKGEFFLNTQLMLGYKRDKDGNVYIDETEAEIVREIYKMYLDGIGTPTIAKILTERGIKTVKGNDKWNVSGVVGILKNEKYSGSALLQKNMNPDFRVKISKVNNNVLPQYYIEDSHEGIVSKEDFKRVQQKFADRTPRQQSIVKRFRNRDHYTKYSGLCFCGVCNERFRHKINNTGTPYQREMLQCTSNESKKVCPADTLFISAFEKIIQKQIKLILQNQKMFLQLAESAFINDKALLSLTKKKEALEAKINALVSKLEFNDDGTSFSTLVVSEIENKLQDLRIEYSLVTNKLLTEYNFDIKFDALKKVLKEIKDLNGDYETFDYKKIFSKVIINSRKDIVFVLNFRSNIENDKIKNTVLNDVTEHLIRKTPIKTKHSIYI
jgi:DNA invertase Pin-like site-specific DNA recombinase